MGICRHENSMMVHQSQEIPTKSIKKIQKVMFHVLAGDPDPAHKISTNQNRDLPGNSSEQEMFPQDQIREEWVHG
jgi:hypothetical protein